MNQNPMNGPVLDEVVARILEEDAATHPNWADVQNRLGLLTLSRGDLPGAIEIFDRCLVLNPQYAWAALNRALCLAFRGDLEGAAEALRGVREPVPGVRGYVAAVLALGAGDPEAGEHALTTLPSPMHDRSDILRLHAALDGLRSPEQGTAQWVRVSHRFAGLDPAWISPWDSDGTIRWTTFVPGFHQLYLEASSIEGRRGHAKTAETMASLARLHWADEAIYLNQRGYLASLTGDDGKARTLHEEAARIAPDEPKAHIALAYHWSALGDLDQAYASLVNALARAPRYADLQYQMGLLRRAQGNLEEALDAFRTALAINPEYTVARLQEAETLFRLERWEDARKTFRRVLSTGLTSADIEISLGRIEAALGNVTAATTHFRSAIRLNPEEPLVHYYMGKLFRERGDRDAAKTAWKQFLEHEGHTEYRAEVEEALESDS